MVSGSPQGMETGIADHVWTLAEIVATAVTRLSVTSVRWTTNGNTLPESWQHSETVYGIGSGPVLALGCLKRREKANAHVAPFRGSSPQWFHWGGQRADVPHR
jgi:hypothetical protein